MKTIGYLLITIGFLAASLVAVQTALDVSWKLFVPLAVLGFAGVAVVRTGHKQQTQAVERVAEDIGTLHRSLENVVTNITKLDAEKGSINTYDMRHKIDEILLKDLDDFAEAREAIGHKYGLQNYADLMSHFAAGERYLNRVWSASADGYIDEVNEYVGRSKAEFEEAFAILRRLEGAAA